MLYLIPYYLSSIYNCNMKLRFAVFRSWIFFQVKISTFFLDPGSQFFVFVCCFLNPTLKSKPVLLTSNNLTCFNGNMNFVFGKCLFFLTTEHELWGPIQRIWIWPSSKDKFNLMQDNPKKKLRKTNRLSCNLSLYFTTITKTIKINFYKITERTQT